MDITSVKFYSYDANIENQPPRIESPEIPMLYFIPAFHKNPPYKRFMGTPKLGEMAKFIQKHADIKFELSVDLD